MPGGNRPINLVLLWHFHQPEYADPETGGPALPWTRLHALKDYRDMVELVDRHPGVRVTINVVPSLLDQLQRFEDGSAPADPFLEVARRPADALTPEERRFIVTYFLAFKRDTLARGLPAVQDLAVLRGEHGSDSIPDSVIDRFDNSQLRDLQVLYHLAWSGNTLRSDPVVAGLWEKGSGFTEEEKHQLLDLQDRFAGTVLARWRELATGGRTEFSVSPYFHPILPLLCDLDSALEALPSIRQPADSLHAPEDARLQLEAGMRAFESVFGWRCAGGWAPEGAISQACLQIMHQAGYGWTASDGSVLMASLGEKVRPGRPAWKKRRAKLLYRPWRYGDGPVILFRDHELSDLIGFSYSSWNPKVAAGDFMRRLRRIGDIFPPDEGPCTVSVILDGENPWEYYEENGKPFLDELYGALEEDQEVRTIFASEAAGSGNTRNLSRVRAGSWIDGTLATWIGQAEKNRAWDLLCSTRRALADNRPQSSLDDPAWRALMAAQGSDWFYWLGDDHETPFSEEFDATYRAKLKATYLSCGISPPSILEQPIHRRPDRLSCRPTAPVSPDLDGKVTDYFEWLHSAKIRAVTGVMPSASHLVSELYFGSDGEILYVRLDPGDPPAFRSLGGSVLRVQFPGYPDSDVAATLPIEGYREQGEVMMAVDKVVEIGIPLAGLPGDGTECRFLVVLETISGTNQTIPAEGSLVLPLGSDQDREADWYM